MPVVLMSDPRVSAIPIEECGEPLVDARGRFALDDRKAPDGGAYWLLRAGVLDRLARAEPLLPYGWRFLIIEGHRPPGLQRRYFESYAAKLATANPEWSDSDVHVAASRYVSPIEVAPHPAGAAVDLTLCTAEGVELDMGTRVNASPEESGGACYTDAPGIPPEAAERRRILGEALSEAGLANYPTEWWHWSYGDRYWAFATGAGAARYGPLD